jgi:subtilisin family serine protease
MAKSGRSGFRIPSFHVEQLVVTCSETVDWSLTDFGIPELWPKTTGKGVKVAVLDTGCAMMHPDLKDQIMLRFLIKELIKHLSRLDFSSHMF